ncbi:MAG TPA: hypothetical protein VGL51_01670 [Solirubrobacteraceae bacterium]|jgi:hypothetical protein
MAEDPRTGPRHEHERHYERAADPAEAADRPLEPKSTSEPLSEADVPDEEPRADDPHHALNNPVRTPDPTADSDPYRTETDDDDLDRASGSRGAGQGAEDR